MSKVGKRARADSRHGHSIHIGSIMSMVGGLVVIGAALIAHLGFRGRDHGNVKYTDL